MEYNIRQKQEIRKIDWSGQLELFPVTAKAVMEEIDLTPAMGTILYEKTFLSFDPAAKGELTPAEVAELEFVGTLFVSGVNLDFIEKMLDELEPPYCYSIHDSYWEWRTNRWHSLPTPPSPESVVEAYIQEKFFDGDALPLVELKDKIEDMLYRLGDQQQIHAE